MLARREAPWPLHLGVWPWLGWTIAITDVAMLAFTVLAVASGQWLAAPVPLIVGCFLWIFCGGVAPAFSRLDADATGARLKNAREPERWIPWTSVQKMWMGYEGPVLARWRWWIETTDGERYRVRVSEWGFGAMSEVSSVRRWLQSSPAGIETLLHSQHPYWISASFVSNPGWTGLDPSVLP